MKKIMVFLGAAVIAFGTLITSYAGQWQQDLSGWRYQNDDGTYKVGWHQDVDGKWYYLNNETGYMLANTTTPDGYVLKENGVWDERSDEKTESNNGYDNKVEFEISKYSNPGGIRELGYSIPVSVYYNNEYDNIFTGKITVKRVEISQDGIPYIVFSGDEKDIYILAVTSRYNYADGTYIDKVSPVRAKGEQKDDEFSEILFSIPSEVRIDTKIQSIEVRVEKGTIYK